jgi:hypothetical protein
MHRSIKFAGMTVVCRLIRSDSIRRTAYQSWRPATADLMAADRRSGSEKKIVAIRRIVQMAELPANALASVVGRIVMADDPTSAARRQP